MKNTREVIKEVAEINYKIIANLEVVERKHQSIKMLLDARRDLIKSAIDTPSGIKSEDSLDRVFLAVRKSAEALKKMMEVEMITNQMILGDTPDEAGLDRLIKIITEGMCDTHGE